MITSINIIGAGMAGLLAGTMLRRFNPVLLEAQPSLPNNHHAVLRFRTDAVSRAVHVPFQRVLIQKAIVQHVGESLVTLNNRYAYKVTGEVSGRSILNTEPGERFIAPLDFIEQMSRGLTIQFEAEWKAVVHRYETPVISTIPMPMLMNLVGWPEAQRPRFQWRPIWTVSAQLVGPAIHVYQTLYYPNADRDWYRASVTGDRLTIESTVRPGNPQEPEPFPEDLAYWITAVLGDFGLDSVEFDFPTVRCHRQEYGKLVPVDEQLRRSFILAMTDQFNIYSLGRFATWRQIVLDDVVNDVQVIERFISERDAYDRRLGT